MKIALKATAVLLLTLVVGPASAVAAWTYTFRSVAKGEYPNEQQGTVLVDGSRWRINLAKNPDEVIFRTSILGSENGPVALNDELKTWFPVKTTLPVDPRLFAFGWEPNEAADIRVALAPLSGAADEPGQWRVTFSYSIRTRIANELVHGKVWGEIDIWTVAEAPDVFLPWKPLDLFIKISEVAAAFDHAFEKVPGVPRRATVHVTRQLENGVALTQTTTREMGTPAETAAPPGSFTVPGTYRKQAPVMGAPGA